MADIRFEPWHVFQGGEMLGTVENLQRVYFDGLIVGVLFEETGRLSYTVPWLKAADKFAIEAEAKKQFDGDIVAHSAPSLEVAGEEEKVVDAAAKAAKKAAKKGGGK